MNKILLLEDDILLGETLVDLLEDDGYEVHHFPNGQDALDATFDKKFDLYILDINVPQIDGLTLLKELREAEDNTPAVYLTSHQEKDKLMQGFQNGCDDFIKKPFDNDELLVRISSILKRTMPAKKSECIDKLCHDEVHKRILYNNEELDLSKKEYQLLLLLMKHVNSTVPKELILDELWSIGEGGSDGALRVYINRIKQLLPDVNIQNIRAVGYKLVL
ncbi:response regulator transcription factor [Sulfurimonas sp.]|uniref:response regulator transcription factor n=1 Tax=Sulfurimonas sp. TaxID=2022749 RepID=UPI003561A6A3